MNGSAGLDNYCPFRKSVNKPDNPILRLSAHNLFLINPIRLRVKLARSHTSNTETLFCALDKAGGVGAEPPQEATSRKKPAEPVLSYNGRDDKRETVFILFPVVGMANVRQKSGLSRV